MKYLYVGAAALFGAAALILWLKFSDPIWAGTFASAFALSLVKALWPSVKHVFRRKSHDEEVLDNLASSRDQERPTGLRPHPDER